MCGGKRILTNEILHEILHEPQIRLADVINSPCTIMLIQRYFLDATEEIRERSLVESVHVFLDSLSGPIDSQPYVLIVLS